LIVFEGDQNDRATLRISITPNDFIKVTVDLNEVPIGDSGKDIMIDFEILDNFETNNILYFDANGLEMQTKYLYKRKEFTLKTDNIISSNFYPVTSAIAVKDFSGFSNK
jgi:hypothetical protein